MKKSQLREIIREAIKNELAENQPKPEQPNTPAPITTPEPGTEEEKEKKRRKIGRPDVEPGKKASIEEEMLKKIVDRYKSKSSGMNEDLDLGHEDDEPHMLRADLYRIAKYAIELYKMLEPFDKMEGEVDLPQWWQEKIIKSKSMLVAAKHYLDFEMKEPSIDASLNGATMNEVTPAQEKYRVKSAKPTQFKQDIAAAKKMIDAGKSEKEVVLKYGQAVFNAMNAQNMDEGKNRIYYHVLEDGGYGNIGWQGYYNTAEEAQKRADKLSDMFPNSSFYVEAGNSPKEPVNVTVEGKKKDMNNDKKIDSKDYLLARDAAIKKSKPKK
jgi:hypothetical protein